ncbi:MAG TPA: helix-turn-helix domain-containing protein [Candidatus Limnocylindrales bacterium]|nr:helix-turn-helix domain-containing protein [Candidatus Limnocylindrales bacterium]
MLRGVSFDSIARAKAAVVAPNGERITRSEKLVLLNLADFANAKRGGIAWPSVPTLAELSLMSERQCRNVIRSLTRKGCITCEHRKSPVNPRANLPNYYRVIVGQELPHGAGNELSQVGKKSAVHGETGCPRGGAVAIAGKPAVRTVRKQPLIKPAADAAVVLCERLSITGKKNQGLVREVIEMHVKKTGLTEGEVADRMFAARKYHVEKEGGFRWPVVAYFTNATWLETDRLRGFMYEPEKVQSLNREAVAQ